MPIQTAEEPHHALEIVCLVTLTTVAALQFQQCALVAPYQLNVVFMFPSVFKLESS